MNDFERKNIEKDLSGGINERDPILRARIGSPDGIIERIQMLIGDSSINAKASAWGVSTATLSAMLKRGTDPSVRNALKIADAEGVSIEWLLAGSGPVRPTKLEEMAKPRVPTNAMPVPMYEVEAAAGAGAWISEENILDYWYVPQSWLRQERLEHAELCIINTIGDSMAPTFSSGDKLLVKLNINRDKGLEGVFAINLDGHLRVKRLEVSMFPHGYRVMSDNELYPEEFVPAAEFGDRLYVIGEVVRVIGAPASQPTNQQVNQSLVPSSEPTPSVSEKSLPGTNR